MNDSWIERLSSLQWTWSQVLAGVALLVLSFVISNALVIWVLIRLPADYFHRRNDGEGGAAQRLMGSTKAIFRTALGLMLIPVGIVMSIPGVVGPGLLVLLVGIMLVDFPRRRDWERRLVCQPSVLRAINRLRGRFAQPPLEID